MLFARQLWDMALPGLQEAGHSRAAASAVFWDFPGVPASEYRQLLLRSCLPFLLVSGAAFPILWASLSSALDSTRWKWFFQVGKLFGPTENTKITLRVCVT